MSRRHGTDRFVSSQAKDRIRNDLDHTILRQFRESFYPDQKLSYLGLPGPELLDLLSWRDLIAHATAVEAASLSDIMELNILRNRLAGVVQPVYANIDDLLVETGPCIRLKWPYHIVNLDYIGGLVNAQANGSSRRIDAVRSLFAHQVGTAFVLLLTLNLRDDDQGELDAALQALEDGMSERGSEAVHECFEKHRELGHAGRLKIYVPILLDNIARYHSLRFVPPVLYRGSKQMIHFVVECIPYTELAAGRISTPQEQVRLVNLALHVLHDHDELKRVQLATID